VFVPLRREADSLLATREYFPHTFRTAVRQRARWVMGIVLQSWERRGWRAPPRQLYWLWRDRKGVAGNLLTPVLNLLFVYGVFTWGESELTATLADWRATSGPAGLFSATFALSAFRWRACPMFAAHLRVAFRGGCAGARAGGKLAELCGHSAGAGALF